MHSFLDTGLPEYGGEVVLFSPKMYIWQFLAALRFRLRAKWVTTVTSRRGDGQCPLEGRLSMAKNI